MRKTSWESEYNASRAIAPGFFVAMLGKRSRGRYYHGHMHSFSRLSVGIALFIVSTACFSAMSTLIRYVSASLPAVEVVFLRNLLSLFLLLPIALYHGSRGLQTARIGRHFWRALVGLIGMELWFYALSVMPLNEATALSYISPIFATIFAVLLLGEKIGKWRILAIIIGFFGAVLILRPDPSIGLKPGALVVLAAAMMWALAGIVVKTLTTTDPPWRIVTYMGIFMSLLSAPPALLHWQLFGGEMFWPLAGIAVFSTAAQLCMVTAFSRVPMVMLAPFDFMRLVFTSVLAYMVFGERLDAWTALGAAIIVSSSAFITWRERRKNHAPV